MKHKEMKRLFLALAGSALALLGVAAQESIWPGSELVSPEVNDATGQVRDYLTDFIGRIF